jgi:hypothetical protein
VEVALSESVLDDCGAAQGYIRFCFPDRGGGVDCHVEELGIGDGTLEELTINEVDEASLRVVEDATISNLDTLTETVFGCA